MGESRDAYRVLVETLEAWRPLGRPRCRWEGNIKMDLRKVGRGMDRINLAKYRDRWRAVVNAVMNLKFAKIAGNFSTSSGPLSSSRRSVLPGIT
jgi:hypothetical protein